jgi:hypothetical protein
MRSGVIVLRLVILGLRGEEVVFSPGGKLG